MLAPAPTTEPTAPASQAAALQFQLESSRGRVLLQLNETAWVHPRLHGSILELPLSDDSPSWRARSGGTNAHCIRTRIGHSAATYTRDSAAATTAHHDK